jgi:hypothetical protein
MRKSIVPSHALVDEAGTGFNTDADPRAMLEAAEVIIAHDVMTDYETIIYGRERFHTGEDQEITPSVLIVARDIETNELPEAWPRTNVLGARDYVPQNVR